MNGSSIQTLLGGHTHSSVLVLPVSAFAHGPTSALLIFQRWQKDNNNWVPSSLSEGYGPMKSVNTLLPKLSYGKFFRKGANPKESADLEASFIKALEKEIVC